MRYYILFLLIPILSFSQKWEYQFNPEPLSYQDVEYANDNAYLISELLGSDIYLTSYRVDKKQIVVFISLSNTGTEKIHFDPQQDIIIQSIKGNKITDLQIVPKQKILNAERKKQIKYYGGGTRTQNMSIRSSDSQGNSINSNISYQVPNNTPITNSKGLKDSRINWFEENLIGRTTLFPGEKVYGQIRVLVPQKEKNIENIRIYINAGLVKHTCSFVKSPL